MGVLQPAYEKTAGKIGKDEVVKQAGVHLRVRQSHFIKHFAGSTIFGAAPDSFQVKPTKAISSSTGGAKCH
jgi:hypothetical protein